MVERQVFIDGVKGVEREYYVMEAAVSYYGRAALGGHVALPPRTSPRDLDAASHQVESTYMVRMWAEFETALRSYRRRITGDTDDQMWTRNLIDWTAGIRQGRAISDDVRDRVHEVRAYRNFLVHQRDDEASPAQVTIDEARRRLNTLLHCLPVQW